MRWLPGGWQRARPGENASVGTERRTVPAPTAKFSNPVANDAGQHGRSGGAARAPGRQGSALLGSDAQDVDVSASSFRNLLIGGGISGFLTVLCAAALVNRGSGASLWIWQLVFGVIFLWFLAASRGMLRSRGFLFDRSGLYIRTQGEVFGIPWSEIGAVGVGSLPLFQRSQLTHPERREALEVYPGDPSFPARHPELDRWLVEEQPSMPGLPGVRYRFHLPPLSRLPRRLEHATQGIEPRKWVGQYRRELPRPNNG